MKNSRTILVTGASKGIGQAIALRLARDGFRIVVHYGQDSAGAETTLAAIIEAGGEGRLITFDIANRDACRERIEQDIADYGVYYGAVLNAGIVRDNAFPAMEDEDWDAVIGTNLDGFYNVLKPVVMPMVTARKGGRTGKLQRRESRDHRRHEIAGDRVGETRHYRQLRGTRDHRDPNDRWRANGRNPEDRAYAPGRPPGRCGRRGIVSVW